MARAASTALMTRVRALATELRALDQDCRNYGDREVAEAIKRARREIEVVIRQGQFHSRGVNV